MKRGRTVLFAVRNIFWKFGMIKKICICLFVLISFAASFALTGCVNPPVSPGDDYSGEGHKIADFTAGLNAGFHSANRYSNGGMFDCEWRSSNVRYNEDKRLLELAFEKEGSVNLAGEYRSNAHYGYGYFSVKMKAVKKPGVVSSFFTYTGRSEGNMWDEIDIEFLGKDTKKVQFNYFTNGAGGHEYLYDLGFDASKALHEYGFKWEADSITWYVDGKAVHRAVDNIPSTPGRIMINAWPGKSEGAQNVAGWSGVFDGVYPIPSAEYEWIGNKSLD